MIMVAAAAVTVINDNNMVYWNEAVLCGDV